MLPDDLTTLSLTDLTALEQQALAAFDAAGDPEAPDLSAAALAEMERCANAVMAIRAERDGRAERRTSAMALRDSLVVASTEPTEESGTDDGGTDGGGTDGNGNGDAEAGDAPAPDTAPAEEGTSASGARRRTASLVRGATRTPNPLPARRGEHVTLTAAADIPGIPAASSYEDMRAIAVAFSRRAESFPKGEATQELYLRHGVAAISRGEESFDGYWTGNKDFADDYAMIQSAARESRLPGGSLTAAGGWCAPSETLYDLCVTETLEGLIDLPEIQVRRGGIRFTKGPSFEDIYADAGFCQTEAQAIAGTAKPCSEIDCPPFEEVRLDACGLCVKAPILTNAAYPELVQRWIEGTVVAQQHKVSAKLINGIVAALGTAVTMNDGGSATHSVLTAVELAVEGLRYKFRLAFSATLEVVAPHWLTPLLRADLAFRNGVAPQTISDAQIASHFANRGASLQYVYDWQPLTGDCPTDYPDTVELLLYPAGTFVKGTSDVISLDTVYDSTGLASNTYVAAFAEEGVLLANLCYDGCRLEIPVCISGASGAVPDTAACYTPAGP